MSTARLGGGPSISVQIPTHPYIQYMGHAYLCVPTASTRASGSSPRQKTGRSALSCAALPCGDGFRAAQRSCRCVAELLRLSYDDGEGEISCLSNPHLTGIYRTWVPPTPSELVKVIAVRQACWVVAYTTRCVGSGVLLCSSSGFASCLKSSREPWIRTVCGPWMCLSQNFLYKVSSSFVIHRRSVFSHTTC